MRRAGPAPPPAAVTRPRVRVGIVSWNTAGLLDRCLAALPQALEGTDAEVVVVDNGSDDGSADVADRHPRARVVRNRENLGYAKAMNLALTSSSIGRQAEVLIALNPDTNPPPGSLTLLVDRLLADPGAGLVAPRLVDEDGRSQWSARRFPSLAGAAAACLLPGRWQGGRAGRRLHLEHAAQPSHPTDVDWTIGAVHVIRAEALGDRSPYDERWFMYVEDLELCWWLDRRGWRCRFEADVPVVHVGNAAGSIAWGDGYMGRCYDAIYDWYQRDRNRVGVRVYAALNAARVASRIGVGVASRRPDAYTAALRRELPHHARTVLHGAPPPAGPPAPK